jgi:predicted transcriptional regulator
MSKSTPVSVRLQPAVNDQITAIAEALDRSKSWVIEQAVKDYVALDAWRQAAIEAGVRDADAGRAASHEDVVAWVRSWGQTDERQPPRCD